MEKLYSSFMSFVIRAGRRIGTKMAMVKSTSLDSIFFAGKHLHAPCTKNVNVSLTRGFSLRNSAPASIRFARPYVPQPSPSFRVNQQQRGQLYLSSRVISRIGCPFHKRAGHCRLHTNAWVPSGYGNEIATLPPTADIILLPTGIPAIASVSLGTSRMIFREVSSSYSQALSH